MPGEHKEISEAGITGRVKCLKREVIKGEQYEESFCDMHRL